VNNLQIDLMLEEEWWVLYVDGSSNPKAKGATIIVKGSQHILIEKSLQFSFKVSNNQVEY